MRSLRPHLLPRLPLAPPSIKEFGWWERHMRDKVSYWHCSAHLSPVVLVTEDWLFFSGFAPASPVNKSQENRVPLDSRFFLIHNQVGGERWRGELVGGDFVPF
jgi:hypothetical protein